MTYLEKLIKDRPDLSENQIEFIVREYCPNQYYIVSTFCCPSYWPSLMKDCKRCWNREAPDDAVYAQLQEHMLP